MIMKDTRRWKLLPICLCIQCGNIGLEEDIKGCIKTKDFLAFEDQDDMAEIPEWCPLEDKEIIRNENDDS